MELILLAIIFGTAAGSFGIKWGIISYVEKYEEKIKSELDRINYKLTDDFLHSLNYRFLLETIYPEFRADMRISLTCISIVIKVLRKYRPFNMKKTLRDLPRDIATVISYCIHLGEWGTIYRIEIYGNKKINETGKIS